ncbi:MAG: dihydroxyacetone kinase subunit DhaK [Tissierellales bacterium]|nr:dihydroxyacetone kinase subunit DhaK [Tissierellales bacterium]MBN2826352.1 dihydroxyacetone kinase subunit DhaK [Tissierellales bacterium]
MKKIINKPENLVDEMCSGFFAAHSDSICLDYENRIILRKNKNKEKVSLISGGGSGHEPSHSGFVGYGMLDAAVCGDVFASPSIMQIYNSIKQVENKNGVLLIVKNYSGDVMNFDGGAELAREEGIDVETVYVDDDVAVEGSLYTVGRRGVAGTIFVHKIAGALAEKGADLIAIKKIAEKTVKNVKTIGFALSSCTNPNSGNPIFNLEENQMEFGVGIHGEPGITREKAECSEEMASRLMAKINENIRLESGDEVAVLVNGLGGTPLQELYVFNNDVTKMLNKLNVKICKNFVGDYMTSLDMFGLSLSILKLDEELKDLLFSDAYTPALKMISTINY